VASCQLNENKRHCSDVEDNLNFDNTQARASLSTTKMPEIAESMADLTPSLTACLS